MDTTGLRNRVASKTSEGQSQTHEDPPAREHIAEVEKEIAKQTEQDRAASSSGPSPGLNWTPMNMVRCCKAFCLSMSKGDREANTSMVASSHRIGPINHF